MSEVKEWGNKRMKLADLNPAKYNPREIKSKNLAGLEKSIERFGILEPIIWNERTGNIVGGHQRLKVLLAKGVEEADVVVVDLPEEEEVAANITLNNPQIQGEFGGEIEDLMKNIKADLPDAFDELLLDDLADDLGFKWDEDDDDDDADKAPPPPKIAKSKYGEVYQLGRHRLMCGDSTKEEDFDTLVQGEVMDACVTDPPYNVAYEGKTSESLTIENDEMSDSEFFDFLLRVHKNIFKVVKEGGALYVFHADSEGLNFRKAYKDAGFLLKQCCIWVKQTMVMGRQDFHWKHEPVLYGWKPGAGHCWNSDRKQTTVWEFDRPSRNLEHPTMKPVDLISYPIECSTAKGEKVIDPFGGSGSTLMACEKTGRDCRTLELDPIYSDVIRRRWAEYVHGEGCDWEELTPVIDD